MAQGPASLAGAMNDLREADDVLLHLAAARGNLHQVWRSVEELSGYARSAERTLDDLEAETARARLAHDDPRGTAYLRDAGDQMDVLRQRCTLTAATAEEIEQRLQVAKHHLVAAREHLAHFDSAPEADVAGLRTKVEDLGVLVDLAAPLAQAARTHMQQAAQTAAALTSPNPLEADREYTVLRLDRGAQSAGRHVVRAEEAARHLDRTLEYAGAGVARSLGSAEMLAAAAHDRLRAGQQSSPAPNLGGDLPGGPAR